MKLLKYAPLLVGLSTSYASANNADIITSKTQEQTREILTSKEGVETEFKDELNRLLNDSKSKIDSKKSKEYSKNSVIEKLLSTLIIPLNRKGGILLENEKEELKNIITNWFNSKNKDNIQLEIDINNSAYMLKLCKLLDKTDDFCINNIDNRNNYLKNISPEQLLEDEKIIEELIGFKTNN